MSDDYQSHNFKVAMAFVRKWEGGYVNDPDDPGGETKYGISKRAYPNEDIKNLTRERAEFLYKRDYWDIPGFDLDNFPQDKAIVLFNVAVNMGVSKAKAFSGGNWRDAIAAIRAHYANIIRKNPKMKKYEKGWENRTKDLESYLTIK